jgi:hypothetical protein
MIPAIVARPAMLTPIPNPTMAPMPRPLLVELDVALALMSGSKVPVVRVTGVDRLERAEGDDDRVEEIEEFEEAGRLFVDIDVRVAII